MTVLLPGAVTGLPLVALGAALLLLQRPNPAVDRLSWLLSHRFARATVREPPPALRGPRLVRRLRERANPHRRRAAEQDELGHAVAAVIAECRAGATPAQAFAAAGRGGRYATSFAAAAQSAQSGGSIRFPANGSAHLASLAVACRMNTMTGMPLAGALAGVAEDLLADRRLRLAVDRSVSGPRSSAVLLAVLPALGVAMGEAMGAHPVSLLVHSPIGLVLLCAGAGLDLAGVLWTRALVSRVRP